MIKYIFSLPGQNQIDLLVPLGVHSGRIFNILIFYCKTAQPNGTNLGRDKEIEIYASKVYFPWENCICGYIKQCMTGKNQDHI